MTDNPSYRGPGQGRPGDEYYDDRYARPQEEPRGGPEPQGGPDPRGGYPPEQAGYPPQQGYPPPRHPDQGGYPEQRGGYPDQGGYPEQRGYSEQRGYQEPAGYPDPQAGYQDPGGYPDQGQGGYPPPSYEQRPPAPAPAPAPAGYGDQGYRPGGAYTPPGPPGGGQPGYGGYGDYAPGARGPARQDETGYAQPEPEQRPAYPEGGGYDQGYQQGAPGYGRPEYGPGDYTQYAESPQGGYAPPSAGYPETVNREYDYGQPGAPEYGQPAGGYGQGGYGSAGTSVTLQLDDGSGRTYQLREGSNIVGRGQDAQFRLPDTGVSRRHLEIRWDGQVALLSDLNSTNGTTVNNAPIQEWQLADGDVVRLGHSEIIVRIH